MTILRVHLVELLTRACQARLFETVVMGATLVGGREQRRVKCAPWREERGSKSRAFLHLFLQQTMTSSNSDNTTSPSSVTDTSDLLSSLSGDVEHIFELLGHDVPDDVADQDIGTLLQQLDRADSIGQDVEGKVDAVLARLDHLLSTLQHDEETQAVDAQADKTGPQETDKDQGR
jgi:hypothetical protein